MLSCVSVLQITYFSRVTEDMTVLDIMQIGQLFWIIRYNVNKVNEVS